MKNHNSRVFLLWPWHKPNHSTCYVNPRTGSIDLRDIHPNLIGIHHWLTMHVFFVSHNVNYRIYELRLNKLSDDDSKSNTCWLREIFSLNEQQLSSRQSWTSKKNKHILSTLAYSGENTAIGEPHISALIFRQKRNLRFPIHTITPHVSILNDFRRSILCTLLWQKC